MTRPLLKEVPGADAGTIVLSARFVPLASGSVLHFHAVVNAFSAEGNEVVSVLRRKGDPRPISVWVHEIAPGSRRYIEVSVDATATAGAPDEYELAMGPSVKGKIFINGQPDGQTTHEPISYLTVSEAASDIFWPHVYGLENDDGTEAFAIRAGMNYVDKVGTPGTSFGPRPQRQAMDCNAVLTGSKTAVLVTFGQSLSSNTAEVRMTARRDVVNLDPFDMTCYKAVDPLLGASNEGGSHWIPMAEKLIEQKLFDRVVIVPIGVGGTYINSWAPGGYLHRRMTLALSRLIKAGIHPTAFLWQHGEAEAALVGYPGEIWANSLADIVRSLRALGSNAPVYVAQSTICGPTVVNNPAIEQAQRDVVHMLPGLHPGPDTDTITVDQRYDKCHYSADGQIKAAELWATTLLTDPPN